MKKCICCNQEKETEDIRLNEDNGFCSSSRTEYICSECFKENITSTEKGYFLKIKNKLYHESNWGVFTMIRDKREIDYIFNRDYYEVLKVFNNL